jgi:RNA polymerase sigma factor (sigma-70 family)
MNYTEVYIKALEPDINHFATKHHIENYEIDDLKQELRMQLYKKLGNYDPNYGVSPRTWASIVMANRIKDLARKENRRHKIIRKVDANWEMIPYN